MQNKTITTLAPLLDTRPSINQVLGYGFLAVTITNMAALTGVLFAPLSKCRGYSTLISFMVATAVGSLFSSAVLVLIPEALTLDSLKPPVVSGSQKWHLPLTIAVCAGALLFFSLEFLLRRIRARLEAKSGKHGSVMSNSPLPVTNGCCIPVIPEKRNCAEFPYRLREPVAYGDQCISNALGASRSTECDLHKSATLLNRQSNAGPSTTGCCGSLDCSSEQQNAACASIQRPTITFSTPNLCSKLGGLDPVVWMIVIGDGVHNFMDGLSIGAGFSQSLSLGLSLTLTVLCEELPHELGDIAVLLQSGLSVPLAILFNFGSACTAYLGLLVGVFVGELTAASVFIFALTAGFFLYIALADMLPEMRSMEDAVTHNSRQAVIRFLIHCFGMLFGFSCILTVVLTSDYITF